MVLQIKDYSPVLSVPGYSERPNSLVIALVVSLLLHCAMLLFLGVRPTPITINQPPPIEFEFLALNELEPTKKQIVAPSVTNELAPKKPTPFISEKDSSTEIEQIKRGLEERNVVSNEKPSRADKTQKQQAVQPLKSTSSSQPEKRQVKAQADNVGKRESLQKLENQSIQPSGAALRLSDELLAERFATSKSPAKKLDSESSGRGAQGSASDKSDAERATDLNQYRPFAPKSLGEILTKPGTPDYLPTIQDGELTMLNAKADRFAVFVRRVALQVFGSLRQLGWAQLTARTLFKLDDFAEVEAVMTRDGRLEEVILRGTSGVQQFDNVVLSSAKQGTWDQNPPSAALAADGKFHFIFKSRCWARRSPDGAGEQRWLLLSTGLL